MLKSESERLLDLIANPPPGSKIEAAIKFEVDLSLNIRSLQLTPAERVLDIERALRLVEALQKAEHLE